MYLGVFCRHVVILPTLVTDHFNRTSGHLQLALQLVIPTLHVAQVHLRRSPWMTVSLCMSSIRRSQWLSWRYFISPNLMVCTKILENPDVLLETLLIVSPKPYLWILLIIWALNLVNFAPASRNSWIWRIWFVWMDPLHFTTDNWKKSGDHHRLDV